MKLELYRKFTNYLAVSVLLSIAWIGYEVGYKHNDIPSNTNFIHRTNFYEYSTHNLFMFCVVIL